LTENNIGENLPAHTHTHTEKKKGFLLAKMRNMFGMIRMTAIRRAWWRHYGVCNCKWPFHFWGQCAKL